MRVIPVYAAVALVLGAWAPGAGAQGWGVVAQSGCSAGLGAAGVASPCRDGSAALFNPAALALEPGALSVGAAAVRTLGSFDYDDDRERVERDATVDWLPHGYLNLNVTPRLSAALGVFAPYSLAHGWPPTFEGRYVSYNSRHSNIFVQPTIAYAPNPRLAFGAGLDVVFSSFELRRRTDLAFNPLPVQPIPGRTLTYGSVGVPAGTDFADATLSTNGIGLSFHVGALARVNDRIAFGARYLHSAAVDLKGNAHFAPVLTNLVLPPGNPLSLPGNPFGFPAGAAVALDPFLSDEFVTGGALDDQDVSTNLELPAQLVVGVALTPIPGLKVVADYQWTGWSTFEDARLEFAGGATDTTLIFDYQNTSTYRVGAEYRATPTVTVRSGFAYNTAAQREFSVSSFLPEAERDHYAGGLGWSFRPNLRLDLALQVVDQSDRRGRVRDRTAGMTEEELRALNVGVYTATAQIFSASITYRFGAATFGALPAPGSLTP